MTAHRPLLAALTTTLTLAIVIVAGTPAHAFTGYRQNLVFPLTGTGTSESEALAVDQSLGNVYVIGQSGQILISGPQGGAPLDGIPPLLTGVETPAKELRPGNNEPEGLAVNPANHTLYVADDQHHVVDEFQLNERHEYEYACQLTGYGLVGNACLKNEPTLEKMPPEPFGTTFTLAVDANGDVYVAAESEAREMIYEYGPTGEDVSKTEVSFSPAAMVASANSLYVVGHVEGGESLVFEMEADPSGGFQPPVAIAATRGVYGRGGATDVAVDARTGDLFVDNRATIFNYRPLGAGVVELVYEIPACYGSNITKFSGGGRTPISTALGVNDATGEVYSRGTGQHTDPEYPIQQVVGFKVVTLPDVSVAPVAGVSSTSAVLSGSVDPDGIDASARFEVGLTSAYGEGVVAVQGAGGLAPGSSDVGSGSASVPVEATVSGLEPNSTYDYRLDGVNGNGVNEGENATFTTPPAPPGVGGESASAVTQTSAVLGALVNPNNEVTSYRFEYGPTAAYGSSVALGEAGGVVGAGFGAVAVSGAVAGLQPGVTYHYRVVAVNATSPAQGTAGPDEAFTTRAGLAPVVGSGEASGVWQEGATIAGTVDPEGVPASYEVDLGTDTSYGTRVFGVVGSSTTAEAVSVSLAGLTPGTTYHYRLAASNAYGVSYGADRTFTTPGFPSGLPAGSGAAVLLAPPAVAFPEEATVTSTGRKATGAHRKAKGPRKAKSRHARGGSKRARGRRADVPAGDRSRHGRGGR